MISPVMARQTAPAVSFTELKKRQAEVLGWTSRRYITTPREAEQFVFTHGIVLRYAAAPSVPLASLRAAAGPANDTAALKTSILLTNHVLGTAFGIEVNVISTRLVIVHRGLMPALYRLVRRGRPASDQSGLSLAARTAYALIAEQREVAAGDVRRRLGVQATPRHDPAYEALAELQTQLLADRGPFVVPKTGIPYLSREGYPYHFFHEAHADLVRAAARLTVESAADHWIAAYTRRAAFAASRTLASLFRTFLTSAEIDASIERLAARPGFHRAAVGRGVLLVSDTNGR